MLKLNKVLFHKLSKEKCLLLYKQIIRYRLLNKLSKRKVYCEEHHIIPNWLCKDKIWRNHRANRINLLIHEHFICHYLLYKYYNNGYAINAFGFFLSTVKELSHIDINLLDIYKASMLYEKIKKEQRGPLKYNELGDDYYENGAKGTRWWNNGIVQVMAKKCPGKDFVLGMKKSTKLKMGKAHSGNLCNFSKNRGKTYEEIYGKEKAFEIKQKIKKAKEK